MKLLLILITTFIALLSSNDSDSLHGKYKFEYTMDPNHQILTKVNPNKHDPYVNFGEFLEFTDGCKFVSSRRQSCGNDIFWTLNGSYKDVNNKLILKYKGGQFTDNIGLDSVQVFKKGTMTYDFKVRNADTVDLYYVSGKIFYMDKAKPLDY